MSFRRLSGFTLVEMMVVVALLAIFVAIAAPSFSSLIRSNRVQAAADELFDLLQYARSEAVTRGVTTTLQAGSATSWNGALTVQAGGQTLRSLDANGLQSGVSITADSAQVSFTATGTAGSTANQCFTLCATANSTQCRFIGVSNTGRITPPSTTKPASGECP